MLNARISHTLPYFRGLVTIGNITYGIEPTDSSSGSKHILYRLDNVKKEPTTCGVTTEDHEGEYTEESHHPSMTQLLRVSTALFSPQSPIMGVVSVQLRIWKQLIRFPGA